MLKLLLVMAVTFGRAAPNSTSAASPIASANTSNAGETGVVHCTLDPGGTLAVTGVTDNASGGSSSYSRQGFDIQGSVRGECYATLAAAVKAATSVSMAFSGTNTDSGIIAAAYLGVLSIGNFVIAKGTGANPQINLPVSADPTSFVVGGFGAISGTLPTALSGGGTLRVQDGNIAIVQALVDNTTVVSGNVLVGITLPAASWVGWALELRAVAGGALPAPLLGRTSSYMGSRMGLR